MRVVVFEDDRVDQLNPISLARPAYSITCGGIRLIDWLELLECPICGIVRPHLRGVQEVDLPEWEDELSAEGEISLLVNARAVPSRTLYEQLQTMISVGQPGAVRCGGHLVAACVNHAPAAAQTEGLDKLTERFQGRRIRDLPAIDADLPLLEYPHDVIRYNIEILAENLECRLTTNRYREIRDGVFAAPDAHLGEYCVTDTRTGPIVLERGAVIGPFCSLSGPAYIGNGARLIEHAAIKDYVTIGHTTKIGGEVEASVIEPFTNKQHHGFLGHSYLGSWINLGAGTCNSDLKNTYGNINMEYRGEKTATGMQFVGCIMGDYAKTAINTGIFTGKTIGVCSMLYGFVTTNVPSFVNYARLFGQVTELPPEIMIAAQKRMFRRRNVEQRPCDVQLIYDMSELTRDERQLGGGPLTF
ncbi:MAG: putative sugar nucleotidyl transferase [Pirellulaceae bacterium]